MGSGKVTARWLLIGVAFVLASSWLGLNGRHATFDVEAGVQLFVDVWSASLVADAVFVLGSLGALYVSLRSASPLTAAMAAFVLNWIVYAASLLALPSSVGEDGIVEQPLQAIRFVLEWGWVGLAFDAAVVPALYWALPRWAPRRAAPAST